MVWHWLVCTYFMVLFFFSSFDLGDSLKFMMSAALRSLTIIGGTTLVSGILPRRVIKTITLSPTIQHNYSELQK